MIQVSSLHTHTHTRTHILYAMGTSAWVGVYIYVKAILSTFAKHLSFKGNFTKKKKKNIIPLWYFRTRDSETDTCSVANGVQCYALATCYNDSH